jgi:succinate dehydrogenase/fumarate reductase flavoprotein subunit
MTRRRVLFVVFCSIILIPITAVLYHRLAGAISVFSTSSVHMAATTPPPVIVVGAGLAGLSAAYSALQAGAPSVRLLERAAKPGGNSIKASSGINGAPTRFQNAAKYGVDHSFRNDTVRSAGSRLHPSVAEPIKHHRERLISVLTDRSASAIDFLADLGVDLSVVAQLGGHSKPRTHRGAGKTPPGAAIVTTFLTKLKEQGDRFQLVTEAEVTRLLTSTTSPRVVTGVEYRTPTTTTASQSSSISNTTTHTLHGPVVFATGGFAGDTHGLLARHRPDLAGLPSTNDPRPGAHALL